MWIVTGAAISLVERSMNDIFFQVPLDILVTLETEFGTLSSQHEFLLETVTVMAYIAGFFLDGIVDKFLRFEFLLRLFMAVIACLLLGHQRGNQQNCWQDNQKDHHFILHHESYSPAGGSTVESSSAAAPFSTGDPSGGDTPPPDSVSGTASSSPGGATDIPLNSTSWNARRESR